LKALNGAFFSASKRLKAEEEAWLEEAGRG